MHSKKTIEDFEGPLGGKTYDFLATYLGYTEEWYKRAARTIPIRQGLRVLDVGCGTGSLTLALWSRLGAEVTLTGIDLAEKQLAVARNKARSRGASIEFIQGSMDALPHEDRSFDLVVSSMAIHGLPNELRRPAIAEIARVIVPGGSFALIDWSRPRLGVKSAIWFPMIVKDYRGDNWNNTYPNICSSLGFILITDVYFDSLHRSQVFMKPEHTK